VAQYTKAQQEFIDGARTTSSLDTIVYVNPDLCAPVLKKYGIDYYGEENPSTLRKAIKEKTDGMDQQQLKQFYTELSRPLAKAMNEQLLGSGDRYCGSFDNNELAARQELINGILYAPGAIDDNTIGYTKYGIMKLPTPQMDTKEEFLGYNYSQTYPEDIIRTIVKNLTTIGIDDMGEHEGGHLKGKKIKDNPLERMEEEFRADSKKLADDSPEATRQWRAFRILRPSDDTHATSASILSGAPITPLHLDIARTLEKTLYQDVANALEGPSKGNASIARGLIYEDPNAFFEALNKSVDKKVDEATKAYKANETSPEAIESAMKAQIYADYAHCFEDAYRRYALEEKNHPDITPVKIVSDDTYQDVLVKYGAKKLASESFDKAVKSTDPVQEYNLTHNKNISDPRELEGEELKEYLEWESGYLKDIHSYALNALKTQPEMLGAVIAYDQALIYHRDLHNLLADVSGNPEQLLDIEQLVSEEKKQAFFEQQYKEQHGIKLDETTSLQPSKVGVDFEKGIVLQDGQPIIEHFAQNADPSLAPTTPASDIIYDPIDSPKTTTTGLTA
jgi:hypothetical protein